MVLNRIERRPLTPLVHDHPTSAKSDGRLAMTPYSEATSLAMVIGAVAIEMRLLGKGVHCLRKIAGTGSFGHQHDEEGPQACQAASRSAPRPGEIGIPISTDQESDA